MRRRGHGGILLITAALAAVVARPYAGGWNDGSRLAAVESLVDHHTFRIDDSIYVRFPDPVAPGAPHPYGPHQEMNKYGTFDKLLIDGAYYSDKSPVPAVLMAGVYQVWRWAGGPSAAERADWFARFLTWAFAGLPLVLAAFCVGRITRHLGVPAPWDTLLTVSFALGSLALAYAGHVNNHILLLGVGAAVCEAVVRPGPITRLRAAWLGLLAGLGYAIDLGAGPPMMLAAFGFVAWNGGRPFTWPALGRAAEFVVAAVPFVAAHHAITYDIAGTLAPANANPAFLRWPGSQFDATTMTGAWNHSSPGRAVLYAFDLLFGRKGFLLYWPPLLLAIVALPWLLRRGSSERPALVVLAAWAVGTWLLYAATSRNLSGLCLSIRWFVPLLAPGCVALAITLRDATTWRKDFAVLAAGGMILSVELAIRGPWFGRIPTLFWPVIGLTLTAWALVVAGRLHPDYVPPASISRTFFKSVEGVKGFWRKCASSARTPWRRTSSGV